MYVDLETIHVCRWTLTEDDCQTGRRWECRPAMEQIVASVQDVSDVDTELRWLSHERCGHWDTLCSMGAARVPSGRCTLFMLTASAASGASCEAG